MLTNWYVRRSRDRFWGENPEAFDTLWTVLETVCRVAAPLLPLTTEEVWRGLTGERSVHLTDWPDADALPADDALVAAMDEVRDVASAGLALRKAHGLRTRLPLASLTLVVDDASALAGFEPILADELNVKDVRLVQAGSDGGGGVRRGAAADGQRPCGRPPAGSRRADRHQGLQVRRLVGRRPTAP